MVSHGKSRKKYIFVTEKQTIKTITTMKITLSAVKSLLVVGTAALLCMPSEAVAKKETISDPRLKAVQSMSKSVKETQFVVKGATLATAHRAVQGFDITEDGTPWFSQPGNIGKKQPGLTKVHETYIVKGTGRNKQKMTLRYFGNGTGMAVEHAEDGDYIWIGSNGTKWHDHYMRTRSVSRIPYNAGTELNEGYAGETYFMGGARYCYPAINVADDILAVATSNVGNVTINIYSLKEARELPNTNIKIKTVWKGENIGEEQETVSRTENIKDLESLDPKANFTIYKPEKEKANKAKDVNSYNFRGFDVDKDYVYFLEGEHNKGKAENGPSVAYITVFDHSGKVVLPRRRISVIGDGYILNTLGLTSTGYADVEGVKVHNGKVYIVFSTYGLNSKNKNVHRANVVVYE